MSATIAGTLACTTVLSTASSALAAEAVPVPDGSVQAPAASPVPETVVEPTEVPAGATEIIEKRDANSKHYLLPDGRKLARISAGRVHYLEAGKWTDIDTQLVPESPGTYVNAANDFRITAGPADGGAPVEIAKDGWRVGIELLGQAEGAPLTAGSRASYLGDGTTLAYDSAPSGLKETVYLASAQAPDTYTFRLETTGCAIANDYAGNYRILRDGDARQVGALIPLVVTDSAETPAACASATMEFTPFGKGGFITYRVPREWLEDPARVYPVAIDPGIVLSSPEDTTVYEGQPNWTYYTLTREKVGWPPGGTGNVRAYIQFPLTSLYSTIVDTATLSLWYCEWGSYAGSMVVHRVNSVWQDHVLTWNNQGSYVTSVTPTTSQYISGTTAHWDTFNMTNDVRYFIAPDPVTGGIVTNGGWRFMAADETLQNRYFGFASGDESFAGHRPTLSVTYREPSVSGVALPTSATPLPTDGSTLTTATVRVAYDKPEHIRQVDVTAASGADKRGHIYWSETRPTSGTWQADASGTGYVGYDAVDGNDKIAPDLARCSLTRGDSVTGDLAATMTVAYAAKPAYGDVQDVSYSCTVKTMTTPQMTAYSHTFGPYSAGGDLHVVPVGAPDLTSTHGRAYDWWIETDADGDGAPDSLADTGTAGRGAADLVWSAPASATAQSVYLFDGYAYRKVAALGSAATTWSTESSAGIWPTDSQIASLSADTTTSQFGSGLALRDDPRPLYAKTAGNTVDGIPAYNFKVTGDFAAGEAPLSSAPTITVQMENRTVGVTDDPRHATLDVGQMASHNAEGVLDKGSLRLSVTDLAIASLGPDARVSRVYDSSETSMGIFGPGWRFNFEQRIDASGTVYAFIDEQGDRHHFVLDGGLYRAPDGYDAELSSESVGLDPGHRLTFKGGSSMLFDSSGQLMQETDSNGNSVVYDRTVPDELSIWAANGQCIRVEFSQGRVTEAELVTSDGRRWVTYSETTYEVNDTLAHNTCAFMPGTSDARTVNYDYGITDTPGEFYLTDLAVQEVAAANWHFEAWPRLYGWSDNGREVAQVEWSGRTAQVTHAAQVYPEHYSGMLHTQFYREFEWSPAGTLTRRSSPYALDDTVTWTSFAYSPGNRVVKETDPLGGARQWAHDARGNTIAEIDEEGRSTYSVYGTSGGAKDRVVSETDPRGSTTSFSYDATGNLTLEERVLTAEGDRARTCREYDGAGRLTKEERRISADESATTVYGDFALSGQPQETSHLGVRLATGAEPVTLTEHADYNEFGDLISKTNALGTREELNTYSVGGSPTSSVDASGTSRVTVRDALGRVTESYRTDGTSVVERVAYGLDSQGNVVAENHYDGAQVSYTVTYTVDALGRTLATHDSVKGDTTQWYDARGNVVRSWGAEASLADQGSNEAAATRSKYDAADRLVATIAPGRSESEATTSTYSPAGLVVRVDQPDGTWVEFAYDAAGTKVSETRPTEDGQTVHDTFDYDLGGRLTNSTKAAGTPEQATTSYTYDLLDRQNSADLGEPSTKQYNTLDWVLAETDFDGIATSRVFDEGGRTISETVGGKTTTTEYDGVGRVTTRTDPAGLKVLNAYDAFGRVLVVSHVAGGGAEVKRVETVYDSLSRAVGTTVTPSGVSSALSYAGGGTRVSTMTVAYGSAVATTTYDRLGQESTQAVRSGVLSLVRTTTSRDPEGRPLGWLTGTASSTASYTASGQLKTYSGPGISGAASYTHDGDTARKSAGSVPLVYAQGAHAESYTYTDAGRLSHVGSSTVTWDYAFDVRGNLTQSKKSGESTVTLAYQPVTDRLLSASVPGSVTTTFTYDALGRRTRQGPASNPAQTTFTYDDASRLTQWVKGSASATYTYDASGQRTYSHVTTAGVSTDTTYTYSGLSLLSLVASQSTGATYTLTYFYDESGRPWAATYAGTDASTPVMFQLVTTDRGDVAELLDASGNAFATYRYDPCGNPIASGTQTRAAGAIGSALAASIAGKQPLRYAGYAYDAASGLYYCSQRYYDPATFQFISKDLARADGEESAYQYCGGDPVGKVDPSGASGFPLQPHHAGYMVSFTPRSIRGDDYVSGWYGCDYWRINLKLRGTMQWAGCGCHPDRFGGPYNVNVTLTATVVDRAPKGSGAYLRVQVRYRTHNANKPGEQKWTTLSGINGRWRSAFRKDSYPYTGYFCGDATGVRVQVRVSKKSDWTTMLRT